ncbi:ABC transporter permease [Bacillus sp. ISL-75]|uniref:ABC transporter permease n=1 Tax=Bacillus sp. ISL-75 TaxID=2819137 RepID=UPI001BEC3573|nr:ABC transporter permease [Bacillus sp. ISL-75]MBT2729570.1 ABC transporter permease [Bacillus sp. ISL-75]
MIVSNNLSTMGRIKSSNLFKVTFGFRETSLLIIIFLVSAVLTILSPQFLTSGNMTSTGIALVTDGIIAIGMTVALVSGAFDLSVGSIMGLASVVAGSLYLAGIEIWSACLVAILVGLICGLINGLFVGKVGLNPFITTLAMMGIARGSAYIFTEGSPLSIGGIPESFRFIGTGSIAGVPFMIILLIIGTIAFDYLMRKSEAFRKVFYIGSNEKAAVLSGINVTKIKMGVFVLTALLASIAGIITLARFSVASPTTGDSAELRAIAAAVIGGTSLKGGEGSVFGAVLGVLLLAVINNGLVLLNVSVYWQQFVTFMILLIAVTIDHIGQKRKTI